MVRSGRRLLVGVALWLGLVIPGLAQEALVQLVPATSNVVEMPVAIGVPGLNAEIRLRNTATDPATGIRRLDASALLIRQSDGQSVPATWQRRGPAAGSQLLRPGETASFSLSATVSEPGIYETWIEAAPAVAGNSAEAQRIRVIVTRTANALPAEFLADPKPVGQTWGGWSMLARLFGHSAPGGDGVLLTLRNATNQPIEFAPPSVVSFTKGSGEGETAVASTDLPGVDARGCASPLGAGKACAVRLALDTGLWPGEYRVGVGVAGVGGGWSERTQIVRVRASAVLAFIVIVAGSFCGWYLNFWRASGRRAIVGLIDTTRLKERLQRLDPDPADAASRRLVQLTADEVDGLEAAVRNGADPAEGAGRLDGHMGRLAAAVEIGRGRLKLSQAGQDLLAPRWSALVAGLESTAPTEAEISVLASRIKALAADVADWPGIEQLANASVTLAGSIEALQKEMGLDGDPATAQTLLATLQAAVETARSALSDEAPPETIAARRSGLAQSIDTSRTSAAAYAADASVKLLSLVDALAGSTVDAALKLRIANLAASVKTFGAAKPAGTEAEARLATLAGLWKQFRGLAFEVNPTAQPQIAAEAAAPAFSVVGVPALDVPVAVTLPPAGTPLQILERSRQRHERLTNALILAVTGVGGVLALWSPNLAWGSIGDVITAFLAGMAAHVVIGEAVTK